MMWLVPFFVQSVLMLWDEFYFHRKRNLSNWERWGHPLDTLSFLSLLAWIQISPPNLQNLGVAVFITVFSSVFIAKDEWVHSKHSSGSESFLHALLFALHPLILIIFILGWLSVDVQTWSFYFSVNMRNSFVEAQALLRWAWIPTTGMLIHQIFYWNVWPKPRKMA
jgi:hypothetical protein